MKSIVSAVEVVAIEINLVIMAGDLLGKASFNTSISLASLITPYILEEH